MKQWLLIFLIFPLCINAQNNIAFINIDAMNSVDKHNPNKTYVSAPFELIGGMMYVKGEMNGEQGHFIFDTGAPFMIINKVLESENTVKATGISSNFVAQNVKIEAFKWANIKHRAVEAVAIDLNHFENASQRNVLGLIGYEVIRDYEVFINYNNKTICLFPAHGNELHRKAEPVSTLRFSIQNHLPVITAKIGDKKLRLGLDTGAEVNLLDAALKTEISPLQINGLKLEEIQGVDKVVHPVLATLITNTAVANHDFAHMKYLFTDMSHLQSADGLTIDGLLGFPFFSKYKMSINYRKGKIYFWE